MRHFEWMPDKDTCGLRLPERQTENAAGYDLFSIENLILKAGEITRVPTGVRVLLPKDEYLAIYPRSSLALKHQVILANGVGVVDADYYGNLDNGGQIFVPLWNLGGTDVVIERGERVAQGIFTRYFTVADEAIPMVSRQGGFGSTDRTS